MFKLPDLYLLTVVVSKPIIQIGPWASLHNTKPQVILAEYILRKDKTVVPPDMFSTEHLFTTAEKNNILKEKNLLYDILNTLKFADTETVTVKINELHLHQVMS